MENCFDKIYNSFLLDKMGHAFLIETNAINDAYMQILNLAKKLNCPSNYNTSCQEDCDICFQIDNFCLPSIRCIEPIGQIIKKEQIIEVKNKFNSDSLVTYYNIYIVKNAEKLNSSSANVLLKFLEDPDTKTLAFFLLNDKKNIIPTIKSRCQIYSYNTLEESKILKEEKTELLSKVEEIFKNLKADKSSAFIKNKDLFISFNKDKKEQEKLLTFIFEMLENEIKQRLIYKMESVNKFLKEYDLNHLLSFTQKTKETIEKLPYNVNMELLLDDYFIKMGELIK